MIRVGYMGIPYSNSWEKAREFVAEKGWDAELVPLMSAAATVGSLEKGETDYAVLPYTNSIAGDVLETAEALRGKHFDKVADGSLPIHHCVFARSADAVITIVSSHIHALNQCLNSLKELYPDAELRGSPDTAYSAQMLAEGKLPETAAVLCRRSAGEHWGLVLLHENIEDRKDNTTSFMMICLPGRGSA